MFAILNNRNQVTNVMQKKSKSYEIDMLNGPLFIKLWQFAIPLMLTGILQLLFNAADMVIVGRFTGADALAAVGSTTVLINLLTTLFIGISVGSNILVARYFGSGNKKAICETVHTSILAAIICGFLIMLIGLFCGKDALVLMNTDKRVLDDATLYIRIYFLGMPFTTIFNFGTAILRASGDTKRPLYFLILSGVLNVFLNIIFVTIFNMGVVGVAVATIISQCLAATLVVSCLVKSNGDIKLTFKNLKISTSKLKLMLQVGIPAGIQSAIISFSNVLIQSSVNSFGADVMAANAAASNIDGFCYVASNAITQTAMSFIAQNVGAGNNKRIRSIAKQCILISTILGETLGLLVFTFRVPLLNMFNTNPEVIKYGAIRLIIMCTPYCLLSIMDLFSGFLRGIGSSITPMIITITGTCLFRILWIYTIFTKIHTYSFLLISYPISWIITIIPQAICFIILLKRKFPIKKAL